MKNVISVDTILQEHREWMRGIRTDHLIGTSHKETKEALYSLLISKLPEKKPTNSAFEERRLSTPESVQNSAYNSAIDDMHRVIDEMFEVKG